MIIDMALPRDVEPAIGEMPDVALITVDDFKHIIDEKMHYRSRLPQRSREKLTAKSTGLWCGSPKSKVDNMVAHFNNHAGELADETIEILNGRLKLTDKEEEFLSKIVRSKFREMVMPSIRQLKTLG